MESSVLTPELASEIADETTHILGRNVLITDGAARVIGSGDASRIGSLHEASVSVIQTGDAASHDAEQAAAWSGCCPGSPCRSCSTAPSWGRSASPGPPEEVVQLGRVVRRQTEILLRESLFQRTRLLRANRLTQLVREIAQFDPRLVDEKIIRASAVELGYDLTQPRTAIVFEVQPGPDRYPHRCARSARSSMPAWTSSPNSARPICCPAPYFVRRERTRAMPSATGRRAPA